MITDGLNFDICSFRAGDALWEAMDAVPRVPRLSTPGCSLHKVCSSQLLLIATFVTCFLNTFQRPKIFAPGAIIAVGIAPFFTGEERHRKTWLKLGYSLIVGTSEPCKISHQDELYLCTLRRYCCGTGGYCLPNLVIAS
jgi:hypothetical protein